MKIVVQFFKAPSAAKRGQKKKNGPAHATVESLYVDVMDHHGNGVVLSTQPITIIDGALSRETVSVSVSSVSKNVRRAKIVSVKIPSEHRIKPLCRVYETCGGCSLQTMNARAGLEHKRDALMRYFNTLLKIDEGVWRSSILSDIDYSSAQQNMGYRRKVRFAVDARQPEQVKIGYRQSQSNKVVDIASCPVLHPVLAQKVDIMLPLIRQLGCAQTIGHIECTQTKNGVVVLINFVKPLGSDSLRSLEHLSTAAEVRLICRFKDEDLADFGEQFASLAIQDLPDVDLDISPQHFIQVNASVNRQMINQAIDWLAMNQASCVVDFFCGIGNFSIPLAKHSAQVIGYEVSDSMVAQAGHNAAINNVQNISFVAADLTDVATLKKLTMKPSDRVLLDPSRQGAQALCERLVQLSPARIVYVSCNPNTLVRDLKILSARYKLMALSALDMFPFTQHLETMALLERKQRE